MFDNEIGPQARVYYEDDGLVIRTASPRYLFKMKAWSARDTDEDDLRVLWPLCGYKDAAEAIDDLANSYPLHLLRAQSRYIIEEVASLANCEFDIEC